ncbi:MAG: nitroreductase family protein [Dehalococcoidaceae bacterium]|nr:nitroreductase family protein [Dehalococcoidaceae bacterium]
MMDVSMAIRKRRSIRSYQDREVDETALNQVLEAARLAPSANNRQEWKFVVVREKAMRQRLAEAANRQTFIAQAPVIIVACATESQSVMMCGQPRYTVDVSIAVAFMLIQAAGLGLGTCWIGAFDEATVKNILRIPENIRVVAMTPLGYPTGEYPSKPRKELSQITSFETYQ